MAKVEITREGTRFVNVTDLMKASTVKNTLKIVAREFPGLPGPKVRMTREKEGGQVVLGPVRER